MSIDPFNHIAAAQAVIGNLTDAIKATKRDPSVDEPRGRATFDTALLLQAGLRALLPVGQREGVALPKIFPTDAQVLQDAQSNYAAVFESGKEATSEQVAAALKAIGVATTQLAEQGYKEFASVVTDFKVEQQRQNLVDIIVSEQNPFPKIDPNATIGERYRPAMEMSAEQAPFYFERLVEWQMANGGYGRAQAERIERSNLGYFAGYYDAGTSKHVLEAFGAAHPIFGETRPDAATAYAMGSRPATLPFG